ncbi:Fc.00g084590.m01.CDS01 [Cosmosporella sp. VM-42]
MEYSKIRSSSSSNNLNEEARNHTNARPDDWRSGEPQSNPSKRGLPSISGAPLEMCILLVIGLLGALGHFLFYRSLDGKPVSATPVSQEWTIRIGTGLAFLAKTCWTVAVIIAHAQQVWMTMDRKQVNLKTADAIFTAVTDFTKFRHGTMFKTARVATALAVVAWCIPLSTIVTPSTLTVVPARQEKPRIVSEEVPMVEFNNASMFAALATCTVGMCPVDVNPTGSYSAIQFRYPNAQTVVLSAAACSNARTLAMLPRYGNSSYTVNFFGPILKCGPADAATIEDIDRVDNLTSPDSSTFYYSGTPATSYYAFAPASDPKSSLVAADFAKLPTSWDKIKNGTIPKALEIWIKAGKYQDEDYTVCALHNASYETTFTFSNSGQSAESKVKQLDKVGYTIALGAPNNKMEPSGYEFQLFTYQAIWMSIAQQLIGRFVDSPLTTSVFQTPLIGSKEFAPYFGRNFGAAEQPFASDKTIPEIVEELSQNITLSLFSSKHHLFASQHPFVYHSLTYSIVLSME